jgi:ElaB/YqjD/DUF883 family membrane-anchored ribosome-binding protein
MDPINKLATEASAGVDKAATRLHNGIRDTYQGARAAGVDISEKADDVGANLADKADGVVSDAKSRVKDGIKVVRNAVQQGRDTVSQSTESVLTYTRENPVKALMIAAVSGAFIWSLAKALAASRDRP